MSDIELRELIASLAIDRKREAAERAKEAAERAKEAAERRKEDAERRKEDAERVRAAAAEREKFNRLTDERNEQVRREMQERDEKSKREIEEIRKIQKKVAAQIGGSENNKGEVAEEFFIQAFNKTNQIGDIQFDHVHPRYSVPAGKRSVLEIDILLLNTMWCAVVEVKYKCHPNDVTQFYEKHDKILTILARQSFDPYYPQKYIFAMASNIFIPACVKRAHKHGIALIRPDGQELAIDTSYLKKYNGYNISS